MMKTSKVLYGGILAALCLGVWFFQLSCDVTDPSEHLELILNIDADKPIYSGRISGEEQTLLIATNEQIGDGGDRVAKIAGSNFIEIPMPIPDLALLASILRSGSGTFAGALVNNADNEVVFGMYFGNTSGLAQPKTMATRIATLTLPASATVSISGPSDFDQSLSEVLLAMLNFFLGNPGISTVYVYLTVDGDPSADVTVQTMSFVLPPAVHIKRTVVPGDLEDYTEKLKEVQNGEITGTITNNGTDAAELSVFVSVVTTGFVSGNPSVADSVAFVTILAGDAIDVADTPSFLVPGAAAKLMGSISSLFDGYDAEVNLFFISNAPLNLQVDGLALKGVAAVAM